jgi:hypothetical protein
MLPVWRSACIRRGIVPTALAGVQVLLWTLVLDAPDEAGTDN